MTPDEAMGAVGRLMGGTPGPWDEPAMQTYCDEFTGWTGVDAGVVLDEVCRHLVATWDSDYRPSLAEIHMRWQRTMTQRTPALPPPSAVHCDGSGWVPTGLNERAPCPRCNPALAEVYATPDKLVRYLDGVGLDLLDVGVERTRRGLRYIDMREPVECSEYPEDVVSPTVGKVKAWTVYAEAVRRSGRDPAVSTFAVWAPTT